MGHRTRRSQVAWRFACGGAAVTKSRGILAPRQPWTAADDQVMRETYPDTLTRDLAARIGRTEKATHSRAKKLGIRKSAAFLAGPMAQLLDGHRGNGTRFQKGQKPWCAGTKGLVGTQEGCRATQFKKGRPAQEARNYLPIGSYRINHDGYLERKMTDDQALAPARRWTAVHRLVWAEANGPIPEDRIVVFKPGQRTAELELITLDRIECITRAEHAERNRLPPELMQIHQLRGQITRAIHKREKEASNG